MLAEPEEAGLWRSVAGTVAEPDEARLSLV